MSNNIIYNNLNYNNQNYYNINNDIHIEENEIEIDWLIDRAPDYNSLNDIIYQINQSLINRAIQFNEDILSNRDDFIPFEQGITIQTIVEEISISEEDKYCSICLETREHQDISQINCGHKFCVNCLTEHIRYNRIQPCCPLCRDNIGHITCQSLQHQLLFQNI
jgi:hypothetical protein